MKKFMVEFTDSVTGSMAGRDDGHPFRTNVTYKDKHKALTFFREKILENGKRYGWKPPKFFEMGVTEIDPDTCIREFESYEKTKNQGEGI